jgi:hypothetical protein
MTGGAHWYVLEFNEGERVTAGGGAVGVSTFLGPLSTRDGEARYSLRLWRAREHPDELPAAERNDARDNCLLAVGAANRLAVELRADGTRYQVGRADAETGPPATLKYDLGHELTLGPHEVHTAPEAAELFLSYHRTGLVSPADYTLREVAPSAAEPTHLLTVNFDDHRPVLPTVEAAEFAAFLADDENVLVLSELTGEEPAARREFLQTAGSAGRYTVEIRQRDKLYTVGHQVDYLVWASEPVEITVGSNTIPVYPNEVFTPAEVGTLFEHYTRTGAIPDDGFLLGEIER